jgi:hypothetical protein
MDVTGLKGQQLDYWVAYAERENGYAGSNTIPTPPPRFSSDPALAEPIIGREGIVTTLAVEC